MIYISESPEDRELRSQNVDPPGEDDRGFILIKNIAWKAKMKEVH
jgi:hypothetical protein